MPNWGHSCYLLFCFCGQGAGGEVYVVSSHGTLPAGCAPHVHGQVVLDARDQLEQRCAQVRGAWRQPLTWTAHVPVCPPITHHLPLGIASNSLWIQTWNGGTGKAGRGQQGLLVGVPGEVGRAWAWQEPESQVQAAAPSPSSHRTPVCLSGQGQSRVESYLRFCSAWTDDINWILKTLLHRMPP